MSTNNELFTSLKKNAALINNSTGSVSVSDGVFENVSIVENQLKKNKELLKRYKKAIKLITENIDLYQPVIDILQITAYSELLKVNPSQLSKVIFISDIVMSIDPSQYEQDGIVLTEISKTLDETDQYNDLLSYTFSTNMRSLNDQYQILLSQIK